MSTVTDALKNRATRGKFITFVLLGVAVCLLLRFAIFPAQLDSTISAPANFFARLLEATAVALLTGLAIHMLAVWLGPDSHSMALIQILDRNLETDAVFERAFTATKNCWYFKGGFGSYFRSKTLPALLKDNRVGLDIMVAVLDLKNKALVDSYAEYRKQASGDMGIDAAKVRSEIRETIKILAEAVRSKPGAFSSARVALLNSYSPFRLDFFDGGAVLTQDNIRAPAIGFHMESTFYQGFRQELEQLKAIAVDLKTLPDKSVLDDANRLFLHLKI